MRRHVLLLSVLTCAPALLPATAAAQARSAKPTATSLSAEAVAGKKVFDAQCAWCHGAGGEGGTGPYLRGKLRHATDLKSIVDIVAKGIPGTEMPAFTGPLTERSMRQAAAYVQSLSRGSAQSSTGNAQRGAEVYAASGCASCHVVSGQGGVLGPELTSIGGRRGPPYLRDAVVKPEAAHPPGYLVVRAVSASGTEVRGIRVNEDVFFITLRDAGGGIHTLEKAQLTTVDRQLTATLMPSYAARVNGAQLDDLVAYLSSLRGAK